MLFVIAAIQRKANFGNRLLKNTSTLNGPINPALETQILLALGAFLATSGSLPRPQSGPTSPLYYRGRPGSALREPLPKPSPGSSEGREEGQGSSFLSGAAADTQACSHIGS